MSAKISVTRSGSVLTASDGKLTRTVEYKHTRAAILVAERLTLDKRFATQWLLEPSKPGPTVIETAVDRDAL